MERVVFLFLEENGSTKGGFGRADRTGFQEIRELGLELGPVVRGHAIGGLGRGRSAGKELDGVVDVAARGKVRGERVGKKVGVGGE